ncbi:MAG: hypothetical protein ACOH2L_16400 [Devosia sp.]
MTITPLPPIILSPREDMVHDIFMLLDEAATSEEHVGVFELAERIVSLIEPSDDDLERLRIFVTTLVFDELGVAGRMVPARFEDFDIDEVATCIGRLVRDEILRGPNGWRHYPDDEQSAEIRVSWRL